MGSVPVHYIDLRTFGYATEDRRRVVAALRQLLPDDHPVESHESTGHYGDPIMVYSARVEQTAGIRTVLNTLADILAEIEPELDDRVTENTELFIQIDKQAAYNGTIVLGDGITVRIKLEAYPAKRAIALEKAHTLVSTFHD